MAKSGPSLHGMVPGAKETTVVPDLCVVLPPVTSSSSWRICDNLFRSVTVAARGDAAGAMWSLVAGAATAALEVSKRVLLTS